MLKTMRSFAAVLVTGAFLAIAVFGISTTMAMDSEGHMSDCPLMTGAASFCRMSVAEHIAHWQRLMAAIPAGTMGTILLVLTLAVVAAVFKKQGVLAATKEESIHFRERSEAEMITNGYLQYFFSRGILHPRIYDGAIF